MKSPIIPAIMPEYFDDVASLAALVRHRVSLVQVDIMDGKYVPEKTWPFFYNRDYDFEDIKKEDSGFPFWEDLDYEIDLMVERPEERLDEWFATGAARIVFHYASVHEWDKISNIDPVMRNFTKIGLGVTIQDVLPDVISLLKSGAFDYVQVMGILHIGYQGEPFDEQCLDVIKHIRREFPDMLITVDGGVSQDTVAELAAAGVGQFVSGSGVFGGGDAIENINILEGLVNTNNNNA